jgi:hypothetical protein
MTKLEKALAFELICGRLDFGARLRLPAGFVEWKLAGQMKSGELLLGYPSYPNARQAIENEGRLLRPTFPGRTRR